MQWMGYWLAHESQVAAQDTTMLDVAEPDASGWLRIRPDIARHILDVMLTMLSAHRLLVAAVPAPVPATLPEIPLHLEVSIDMWWRLKRLPIVR